MLFIVLKEVAQPCAVDRYHTHRPCLFRGTKKTIAALEQFTKV